MKQVHRAQAPLWTLSEAQAGPSMGTTTFFSSSIDKLSPVVEVADGGLHCPLMQPVPVTLAGPLQIPSAHFSLLSSLEAASPGCPSAVFWWGKLVGSAGIRQRLCPFTPSLQGYLQMTLCPEGRLLLIKDRTVCRPLTRPQYLESSQHCR